MTTREGLTARRGLLAFPAGFRRDRNNPRAAMLLGQMYRAGIGMKADPTEAYAWSEVATLEGNVFAERERDASFHDLSTDDQKAAITRAQEILKTVKSKMTLPKVPESK
jgi:TPR repeat protein